MSELPSIYNVLSILRKCRKRKNLAYAKSVHAHICNNGLESNRVVGNHIVPMFVECGSMSDAQQVFNTLVHRNEHSWTSLMLGYVECGESQHALNLYQKMQHDSVHPSSYTLVAVLKACARLGDVERGRGTHMKITQNGFERDAFVGNTLVDMYAKCASLPDAREVFDNLPFQDVVSWNALVAGYAEHGPGEEVLTCFEQMQVEGVSPDSVTFVCILKACGRIGGIDMGREIHADVAMKGFGRHLFVGNSLIDMYAKCGSVVEAREVFDNLPVRDTVSWTSLIAGYVEHGLDQEALLCFEQMQLEAISPNSVTFVFSLKACSSIGSTDKGHEIHTSIIQKGFEIDVFVGNTLVDMYAKCGSLAEARDVFDNMPHRTIISWNTLIAGYAEHGLGQEALKCLEQMQLKGISPDAVTFVCALKACGNVGAIDKVREIHVDIAQKGLEKCVGVGNTLVHMYVKCGLLAEAREVFDNLPVRDAVSWTELIAGYAEHGPGQESLKCFGQMQEEGTTPDSVTFVCALKACGSQGVIDKGREIHAEIAQKGLEKDLSIGNALADMYAKCGSIAEAWEVFRKLPVRDALSWTALIAGYAEHGPGQEALKCFEQMQLEGISPDAITFTCTLKACGSIGAIDKAREIHADIAQKGFERDTLVGNMLVDMYAKCGSLLEAQGVFDNLLVRDVVTWTAMIEAYGMNYEGNMAAECFEDMQEQGVKPDDVTFTCLLAACSRARLVLKGQQFFNIMRERYGIAPTIHHYTCMAVLLAESGHLYEAENFVEIMPCTPLWTALLSACKIYGEAELGQRCFQQLVQMDPESAASYALMAKIYASAGRWDDAHRIENLRKRAGAMKKPARALIEVNKKVHEFVVGNNESKEISAMLGILGSRMEEEGHVPNVNLVVRPISDEEKEAALCQHAEKLAIAFGLLNTPQGQTLRVTKNLRMCNNCHDTIKMISRIERREIIVREVYHVHHFKDGLCSCRDLC